MAHHVSFVQAKKKEKYVYKDTVYVYTQTARKRSKQC